VDFLPTAIPGCFEIKPRVQEDERGLFVKTFHADAFRERGLAYSFAEEYYSVSHQRVLRGFHFHLPPHNHAKLVYCLAGEVLDAVVDLRRGSSTFGQYELFELTAKKKNILYIPSGLAHGFYVQSGDALMIYKTTTLYSPEHDAGIRWDSVGINWPDKSPIVSERDHKFVRLAEFESPFSSAP